MATWSNRRKYGYLFIFVAALVLLFGVPSFFIFYKAPTCFDGVQNGGETGIDCGGGCVKLCPADFAPPRVLWSYAVQVLPGVYNALAYVQNPNPSVQASSLPYDMRIYDDQGLLIAERTGSAFIPAGQKFAVFEGGIDAGRRVPARTTFEFTSLPNWTPGAMSSKLHTDSVDLVQGPSPKAEVVVRNESAGSSFSNIDTFIILYDKDDNRVSFSKTVIDSIAAGGTVIKTFTWPQAFPTNIVRTEVLFTVRGA